MAWLLLIVAGLMEPCWVYTMERSDDFRIIKWDIATVVITAVDMYLLAVAMETIGAGFSYAIWTGIGAVMTFLMGIFIYHEKVSYIRVLLIMVIIGGIVGLNLAGGA